MTLLDFLSQHTSLIYWTMVLTFLYGMGRQFTAFAKTNVQKYPDPGKNNTYVTNNYWPGTQQDSIEGTVEEGIESPPSTGMPQSKDML